MANETSQNSAVRLRCICGQELAFKAEVLGRVFRCPHCRRYLRPALQFLLLRQDLAPNLTALCTCGRFIVAEPGAAGRTVQCGMCGNRVVLPKPAQRAEADRVVRISPKTLERQMKRIWGKRQRARQPSGRAARRLGHTTVKSMSRLRPGSELCVNPACRLPLPVHGNVCPRCGVNVRTGVHYEGIGPERDPKAKWKRIRPKGSSK